MYLSETLGGPYRCAIVFWMAPIDKFLKFQHFYIWFILMIKIFFSLSYNSQGWRALHPIWHENCKAINIFILFVIVTSKELSCIFYCVSYRFTSIFSRRFLSSYLIHTDTCPDLLAIEINIIILLLEVIADIPQNKLFTTIDKWNDPIFLSIFEENHCAVLAAKNNFSQRECSWPDYFILPCYCFLLWIRSKIEKKNCK